MKMNWFGRLLPMLALFLVSAEAFAQKMGITGNLEWDTKEIKAVISLNLASAGIRLPSGRPRGEAIINSEYQRIMRPAIMGIQVDSSSAIHDLVQRGELSPAQADGFAVNARITAPYLSPDLLYLQESYVIKLDDISSALIRHNSPGEIKRTLSPVAAPAYTGIIIIASSPLPVHGMLRSASVVPCLFPKIWDTDMNLIFERNMMGRETKTMVRYAPRNSIFQDSPSGLSPEIAALAGSRPMRIFAQGLFGSTPTDLIIDAQDALLIISSEENRRLLREGKVIIIVDDAALKIEINEQ